jgi:hypothetical protein
MILDSPVSDFKKISASLKEFLYTRLNERFERERIEEK